MASKNVNAPIIYVSLSPRIDGTSVSIAVNRTISWEADQISKIKPGFNYWVY